jgi:hypothetical protein
LHIRSARDARAAHFERLLAAKEETKPTPEDIKLERIKDEDTPEIDSDDFDWPEDEEELDDYAKEFLAEMNEEERKVARGDDMLCTLHGLTQIID